MRDIATSQFGSAPAESPGSDGPAVPPLGVRLGRRAADVWLNLLYWRVRQHEGFIRRTKPLWLWGAWRFSARVRQTLLINARRLLGDGSTPAQHEALAKAMMSNAYDFVCDIGRCRSMSRRQLLGRIDRVEGDENYRAARAEKKGAIIVTAHMGSFEIAAAALLEHERRVHVLFHRDLRGLFEKTRSAFRRRMGLEEICVEDGLSAWARLREALAADEVVLIQGDRVMPGQKGRAVLLLGGHVMLPTGPVKLALATGAPIVPTFCIRNPDGKVSLFIERAIRPRDGTADELLRRVAAVIEKYLVRFPDQWLVFHRPWCEDAAD